MAMFAMPLMAAATAAAAAVGAYSRFYQQGFEIRQVYKGEAKEMSVDEKRASRKSSGVVFAPEFDGLHCYENLISR
ncbi:hypothetical protein SUGI_0541760 [Cryptomeria japonica]|nr:hypothetical protein SUGI_0541760 [Cryptomeria japonica]